MTRRSCVALVTFEAAMPLRTRHAFGANGPWRPSQSSWAGGTCWAKCSARAHGTNGSRCAILAILAIVSTDTFWPSCSGGTGATSHLEKCECVYVISSCPHEYEARAQVEVFMCVHANETYSWHAPRALFAVTSIFARCSSVALRANHALLARATFVTLGAHESVSAGVSRGTGSAARTTLAVETGKAPQTLLHVRLCTSYTTHARGQPSPAVRPCRWCLLGL